MTTVTRSILVRIPEHVANRLATVVPRRKRNQFIVDRIRESIDDFDASLAVIASKVTAEEKTNPELKKLLKDFDTIVADGLRHPTPKKYGKTKTR